MREADIRGLIAEVKGGALSRRDFVRRMATVGVAAPVAGMILAHEGVAFAQAAFDYKPSRAGGGGPLKVLQWQGPTLLNAHLSPGSKDWNAANIFYEALAGWDMDGNLEAILAEEVPSRENGGVAPDAAR